MSTERSRSIGQTISMTMDRYGVVAILLAMVVILSIATPHFLRLGNLLNVARQITIYAISGFGVTMVIISGGIDLSIGSLIAFSGVIAASFAHPGQYPIIVPVAMGILSGIFFGFINGSLVAFGKMPPFIATLGMMTILRGLALVYTKGFPITGFSKAFEFIGGGRIWGIPFMIYMLVIAAILSHFILDKTKLGRYIYATGGNERAAIASGINVTKVRLFVYSFAGAMSGLAGILLTSRLLTAQPSAAMGYELDAIMAAVIGGTGLSGGTGSIWGTLIGALIVGILNNGMDLLQVSPYWQQVARGMIIILAILSDSLRKPGGGR